MDAVFTAGSSKTGLIHVLKSAASARITTVMIDEMDTATQEIASPSGVFASFFASFMAFTATGTFRFIILPVMKVRYVEEPRIGVICFSESEIATDVLTESSSYNLFDPDDDMGEDNFQSDR